MADRTAVVALSDELADANLAAQEKMFADIGHAAESSGRDAGVLARLMGIPTETVASILDAGRDITLSDLQELCLAADVRLAFTVDSAPF